MRGYDEWLAREPGWDEPERQTDPGKCRLCNGSGEYAMSVYNFRYMGPGPVPDDARRGRAVRCESCGGTGEIVAEEDEP